MRMTSWIFVLAATSAMARADDAGVGEGVPRHVGVCAAVLEDAVDLVRKAVADEEIHGAVLLVARHGHIELHEAIGWRNVEEGLPMETSTLFKMASNTKPVIATAILKLVEEGRLNLDDRVGQHIESWSAEDVAPVTIRQLLSHTSGLRIRPIFITPLLTTGDGISHAPSLQAEVDRFAGIGIEKPPGQSYSYSNPGYQVLGRLIEVASEQPLREYLRRAIYEPLNMADSWNHESDAPTERMGCVYAWEGGRRQVRWKPADGPDWPIVRASGGMISTAADYAAFCQMYLNDGEYNGRQILQPASIREATRPQTLGVYSPQESASQESFYGLGWVVDRQGIYSHSGSDGTKAWVDPHRQLIVLVFTQSPGENNPRDRFFDMVLAACDETATDREPPRPRLRDLEISIGVLPTGPTNSLTDVSGVRVGHRTIVEGDSIRTGVTAILPHGGNLFQAKVPAAVHVANGFGKFVGTSQVEELGVLETPILLTNTLSTFAAADALAGWTLGLSENEQVLSVNPVVGECNDGYLNDIRMRRVTAADVEAALRSAHSGPVTEGCVGAGTGTRCMGWKGGIGTSSRRLPESLGGYTVGVLVQTNFGGSLSVAGVPVGRELGRYYLKDELRQQEHGSCIVVVATDAPLDARRLKRLAQRAPLGLAAAGSPISHGSGDYVLAFSTHKDVRSFYKSPETIESVKLLRDDALSPLFQAVRDATEEAVINSLLQARTLNGREGRRVEAIDPQQVREICRRHGAVDVIAAEVSQTGTERTYGAKGLDDRLRDQITHLSRSVEKLREQHKVPGVSVAVVSDRELVWSSGFGTRCSGSVEPVLPETVMEACSMSKPFFGYLLLKLVEDGKFDLERPLVEYLQADYLDDDPRHRTITAGMVLSHTSGLPNWRAGGWRSGSALTLGSEPGTTFRYSGEGFLMLQRAVEKHLNTDLDTLSRERLIEPLGLRSTRFVWDDRFISRSSCGHDGDGSAKTDRRYYDRANAAYTLYTSAEDYARFLAEILNADRTAAHSLSSEMISQMLSPVSRRDDQFADWGLGWGLRDVNGECLVYHSGSNGTGFRCYSEFVPSTGSGLVIMTNATGGAALWKALVEEWHDAEP